MNTNKKGFTLIELLATFVVLALLMTITGVSINKQVKQSETAKKGQEKQDLFLAAETYKLQFPTEISGNCVAVSTLVSNNFIKSSSIKELGKNGSIKLGIELKNYQYCTDSSCTTSCEGS